MIIHSNPVLRFRLHRWWVLFVLLSVTGSAAFSQPFPLEKQERERHNLISLHYSIHEFFDGAPFIQWRHQGKQGWMNIWLPGISYARVSDGGHGFYASTSGIITYYYVDFTYPTQRGDIMYRESGFFEGAYLRRLVKGRKVDLQALAGISYRIGYESALNYIYRWEVRTFDYYLSDWGLLAAIRSNLSLLRRFRLSGQVQYTEYLIRRDNSNPFWPPEFHNRSTRRRLTFQLGLGYSF